MLDTIARNYSRRIKRNWSILVFTWQLHTRQQKFTAELHWNEGRNRLVLCTWVCGIRWKHPISTRKDRKGTRNCQETSYGWWARFVNSLVFAWWNTWSEVINSGKSNPVRSVKSIDYPSAVLFSHEASQQAISSLKWRGPYYVRGVRSEKAVPFYAKRIKEKDGLHEDEEGSVEYER